MTNRADYETLLSSMSALSQQFSQRRARLPDTTSPNALYHQQQSRSRVFKTRSTNASPSTRAPQRKRTATVSQTHRPFAHATSQLQAYPTQAQAYYNAGAYFDSCDDGTYRPRSWHANLQTPTSWLHPHQGPIMHTHDLSNVSSQTDTTWNLMPSNFMPMSTNTQVMPWMQSDMNAWEACQSLSEYSMQGSSALPLYNHAAGELAANMPIQPETALDSEDDENDGPSLVGMGLYDKPASTQRDVLLGGCLDTQNEDGRGLRLAEGWAPPADQVPEAEADEGSDTPVTADCKDWSPSESFLPRPAPYYDDVAMPHVRHQTETLFEDDGNLMTDDSMVAAQNKVLPMGWYGPEWSYPGYGFYST